MNKRETLVFAKIEKHITSLHSILIFDTHSLGFKLFKVCSLLLNVIIVSGKMWRMYSSQ